MKKLNSYKDREKQDYLQSGRLRGVIDDAMLRNILGQITPQKREITIQRR